VLSRAIISDMHDKQTAASLMGYVSMAMAVAPMMGPMAGGVLEQIFDWRASFAVYAASGIVLLIVGWIDVGETNASPSETFAAQFRAYPELLRSRRFWGYSTCTAFSVGTFFIYLGGAPLAASAAFGLSPAWLGVGMGCTTAGFFFGNLISGRYSTRMPLATMMTLGRLATLAGLSAGAVLMLAGLFHPVTFFCSVVSVGIGNGLTLPAGNAGAMAVRPRLAGSASGLSGALQVGGGAALTVLAGILVTEEHGIAILMGMLILCTLLGLAAALYVMRLDRVDPLPDLR
jgi:predicted MFS family arabinose efflux permease